LSCLFMVILFCLVIVLRMRGGNLLGSASGLAKPASPQLHALVEQSSACIVTSPLPAYVLRMNYANAFAFPLCQRIGITDKALAILTDDEVITLFAHELGHLVEPWYILLGRVTATFLILPLAALGAILNSYGL